MRKCSRASRTVCRSKSYIVIVNPKFNLTNGTIVFQLTDYYYFSRTLRGELIYPAPRTYDESFDRVRGTYAHNY